LIPGNVSLDVENLAGTIHPKDISVWASRVMPRFCLGLQFGAQMHHPSCGTVQHCSEQQRTHALSVLASCSPEVTVKGFKKCCVSNAMDETEDDMLWSDHEDGNIRTECEEDEGTDCEDGDIDTDWKSQIG
jgi:hypothetical protein